MKRILAGVMTGTALIALPIAVSAQSTGAQNQIQALLAQVQQLQQQIQSLVAQQTPNTGVSISGSAQAGWAIAPPATIISPSSGSWCSINRTLYKGASGSDVLSLQDFLSTEGYFSGSATGYFGSITGSALAKWQLAQGLSPVGIVGPLTRAKIAARCQSDSGGSLSAYPTSGAAPLTVNFWYLLADAAASNYSISYGDGSIDTPRVGCGSNPNSAMMGCPRALVASHTYSTNGTYTATLTQDFCNGAAGCMAPVKLVGKITIAVGGGMACKPINYMPIACADGSQPIPTKDSNGCITGYVCPIANFTPDASCQAWFDGCNNCSRTSPTAPAACTMRACFAAGKGYCISTFNTTLNNPPVISLLSGPTTLDVGAIGTWTINASDPQNGTLLYHVTWGDEGQTPLMQMSTPYSGNAFVQTTTFTHSYATAGTYTVSVTVKNSAGLTAVASATVQVGGGGRNVCAMIYDPVCGQPPEPACRHSVPACMIATPGPTTYSNTCVMQQAGATLLYTGACHS